MHLFFIDGKYMTKVLFFFAGTGSSALKSFNMSKDYEFKDDVIRIYCSGCQDPNVGKGKMFPNLNIVANKIKSAFNTDGTLDLVKLKQTLGSGLGFIQPDAVSERALKVERIGLEGFSRGAVTTFAVAKKLDSLGIPIDIISNQPVPGPGLFSKYSNLTRCTNIQSAMTLIASYHLENGAIQNHAFHQMVAQFPEHTAVRNLLLPHQGHFKWEKHALVSYYTQSHLGERGYIKNLKLTSGMKNKQASLSLEEDIKAEYKNGDLFFTPKEFAQRILYSKELNLITDPLYLEAMREEAHEVMHQLQHHTTTINDDQAIAIAIIGRQPQLQKEEQKKLIQFILKSGVKPEKFIKMIQRSHEMITFLTHATDDGISNKSNSIKQHAPYYYRELFLALYDYLRKVNPTKDDRRTFCMKIDKEQSLFAEKALAIDRTLARKALAIITNTILHLTGLCLLVNTINLAANGHWFLFDQTRSEKAVGKVAGLVKASVEDGVQFSM